MSPGELIAVSSVRLGIPTATASTQNTTVTFDGIVAPLVNVTSSQITAMVPYDIAGKFTTSLKVTIAGQSAPVIPVNIALTAPGIFTLSGLAGIGSDQAAVLNADGTVNSQSNPAVRGSEIAFYGTGEVETFPQAVTGALTPGTNTPKPLAATSATIDSLNAQVLYAGSAPGLIAGVLQVNAIVPASASTGAVQIALTAGAASSQRGAVVWLN